MKRLLLPLCLTLLCAGCAESTATESGTQAEPGQDPVRVLREAIAEVSARPEHDAAQIEVQHILIAFAGTGVAGVTRSREEAEPLAAELFARIQAGEDFDALVKEYTDDSHPGIYLMSLDGSSGRARSGMVGAFGDVGWRLEVGEVGVAGYDPAKSKHGWHIIKRLR